MMVTLRDLSVGTVRLPERLGRNVVDSCDIDRDGGAKS